jgi:hypothetical protein
MARRSFRRDCRGQVIIVSALLVALILLSTAIYVIDIQKDVPMVETENSGGCVNAYKSSVRNALVSALANVTGGGSSAILASDLAELKAAILEHSYQSLTRMDYNLRDDGVYSDGVWVSWGNSGDGVSSAYVSVTFSSKSSSGGSEVAYVLNVTSRVHVSGGYVQLNETHKQVNLTVNYYSESGDELAQNLGFSYQNASSWVAVGSPTLINYGNGTYIASFYAQTTQVSEPLDVSTICLDTRGISVGANLTCNTIT